VLAKLSKVEGNFAGNPGTMPGQATAPLRLKLSGGHSWVKAAWQRYVTPQAKPQANNNFQPDRPILVFGEGVYK
jgi:hypothetical protein